MNSAQNIAFNGNDKTSTAAKICALNDAMRRNIFNPTDFGDVILTPGVSVLRDEDQFALIDEVRCFEDFNKSNDPYGEHDFGAIQFKGEKYFWKIDYYAPDLKHHSVNPGDKTCTRRVLKIMQACEY